MHNKPKEFDAAWNRGSGYEVSAQSSGTLSESGALNLWKGSEGHNGVILNKGVWKDFKRTKIGAAITDGYANAWFSN